MNWADNRGQGLVIVVVVILVVLFAGLFIKFRVIDKKIVAVAPGACTCADRRDIENRLAEAGAAEAEIRNNLIPSQQGTDPSAKYTPALYGQGKAQAQQAVDNAPGRQAGANKATGETYTDCTTHPQAPTPCLRAAIQSHENVHSANCQAFKDAGGGTGDYKEAKTMVDYWAEDADGYAAEQAYLKREKARLDRECNPVVMQRYPGVETKEQQQQRLAAARRRLSNYVRAIN